jgi:hypothetical protein
MRKLWLLGGAAVVIAGSAAFMMLSGAKSPFGGDKKDGKPPPATLEFTAREVVHPQNVALPTRIEFSGPLVAPPSSALRPRAPCSS